MANERSYYSLEEVNELLDAGFFDQDEEINRNLEGKGGGKGRFNAKINKLKNVPQIEQKVKDYLIEKEK